MQVVFNGRKTQKGRKLQKQQTEKTQRKINAETAVGKNAKREWASEAEGLFRYYLLLKIKNTVTK